jgi:hypothetical protein
MADEAAGQVRSYQPSALSSQLWRREQKKLELIPKPHPWMPAGACPEPSRRAGMTEGVAGGVIPAKAGIQVFAPEEVLG